MKKLTTLLMTSLLLAALTATAGAMERGRSMLSIGLGQGTADGYAPITVGTGDYLEPTSAPELNAGAEYWFAFSEDYALALSGAYGFSTMTWEPADAGDPEIKATGSSLKFRVGADRTGHVGERLVVFMGPGVEFWTGKQKIELGGAETETESVNRFGVSGRLGGFMMFSDQIGVMGQVGHTFGFASADDGAKTTWTPSSFQASWGLTFAF